MKISSDDLSDALRLGRVPDDEILAILSGTFPLSRWESGRRVAYFHSERGHALDVVYEQEGDIARFEPRPGLSPELLSLLREQAKSALAADAGFEVRRAILFSTPEIRGYWRHGDEWQILPAPTAAPRPEFPLGQHPFVIEYRVRASTNSRIAIARQRSRLWDLHVLLSLALRGAITRESESSPHHWF